ncbi:S41 family peptidase [Marisediminicola sp. LYQ134]|uniref:S41 family peptidase n=1 Tax=Marisediminicola sp. LYQ134 TaxID=3391061 RepID=UPI0039838A92
MLTLPATSAQTDDEYAAYIDAGHAAQESLGPEVTCGWVLDLRGNTGGNMWPMLAVATPFIDTSTPMSFERVDGTLQQVILEDDRALLDGSVMVAFQPADPVPVASIVLLHNETTASSGEAIVATFLGQNDVTTMGRDTAGLSTGNESESLTDGAQIILTTSTFVDRTGLLLGGSIAPDIQLADTDDGVLEARDLLDQSCGAE